MVRLLRVLRLTKVARHSDLLGVVVHSVWETRSGLYVLSCMVLASAILAATAAYFAESDVTDTEFVSIPASLWWAFATIFTVGYGDMVPSTVAGKFVGCCTMVVGILITSISVALINKTFTEQYQQKLNKLRVEKSMAKLKKAKTFGAPATRSKTLGDFPSGFFRSESAQNPKTNSRHTLSGSFDVPIDVAEQNLVTCLKELEEKTASALMRLESVVLDMQGSHANETDGGGMSERAEYARMMMQVLKQQGESFFRSAGDFAHLVVCFEAQRQGLRAISGARPHERRTSTR